MNPLILAAALAAAPLPASPPPVVGGDPRIQFVDYDPNKVVGLTGALGYLTTLEFDASERIENVAIGDALGWQVTPNRRANILFVKPLEAQAATNMTVVTTSRRYVFQLSTLPARTAASAPYLVHFVYPEAQVLLPPPPPPPPPPDPGPKVANSAYEIGPGVGAPSRVFDDGTSTYFRLPPEAAFPAIFAVSTDKKESVVNYAVRGDLVVVDQLAPRFVLRNGAQVTTVTNTLLQPSPSR